MKSRTILGQIADRVAVYAKERADAWWNPFTGFGDPNRDRTMSGRYIGEARLDDLQLDDLYHTDDMAKKVCSAAPRAMLKKGFGVELGQNKPDAIRIVQFLRGLNAAQQCLDAMIWGNVFGGGVLLLGADDGLPPDQPLNVDTVKAFTFIDVQDRRRLVRARKYEDPKHPKYRQTEVYMVTYLDGRTAWWHESRMVFFGGAHTATNRKEELDGWDYSVLQTCYEPLRQFNKAHKSGELLLDEASQGVFKMRGMLGMLASGGMRELQTRLQLLDMSKSVARSIFLDQESGEDYTKIAAQFSGVPDMLDRSAQRLAAAGNMPVTVLMGRSPAGLNATGESDVRHWYDELDTDRENELAPRLLPLVHLAGKVLAIDTSGAKITFPSFWLESPPEQAARRKTVAETDQIYVTIQAVTPEEVALSRFTEDGWSEETTIDRRLRVVNLASYQNPDPNPQPTEPTAGAPAQ